MKKILYLLFITFNLSNGQSTDFIEKFKALPQEKIFVHYNDNFLITGERLYYSIYCLQEKNNFVSDISKVAYIELINSKNKSILKQKVNLKKGIGYSDFFIATNLKTASYKVIAYTQWMKNKQLFFEENIYIINPFENKSTTDTTKNKLVKKTFLNDNNAIITTNKKVYNKRAQVHLSFNNKLIDGNYSVSVKQKKHPFTSEKTNTHQFAKSTFGHGTSAVFHIPEVRGNLIQGKITSKDPDYTISNIKLGLSTVGGKPILKTGITNNNGAFFFNLKSINTSKIRIQILDENYEKYTITLSNSDAIQVAKTNFKLIPSIDASLLETINNRTIYLQIENAYNAVKKDSLYSNHKSFLAALNDRKNTIVLDDYKRFKTTKETMVEILEDAFFSKKNDTYTIHIRDTDLEANKDLSSLLIIDGHIIYNHTEFLNLNAKTIHTISLIKDKYVFGSEIYQGIIIVDTFKKNYQSTDTNNLQEFIVLKSQPEKKYFFTRYATSNKERIPDYRTQLYWNPTLNIKENGITFFSSDITGEFEIEIEGFTHTGKPISIKNYFYVQ